LSGGNFCRTKKDKQELANIAMKIVVDFSNKNANTFNEIRFVLFDKSSFDLFKWK